MKNERNDMTTTSTPSPSPWRKRLGMAGLASAGGMVAFLTARSIRLKAGGQR